MRNTDITVRLIDIDLYESCLRNTDITLQLIDIDLKTRNNAIKRSIMNHNNNFSLRMMNQMDDEAHIT